jgi:transcriptional regulator with XRE-family HTH domain
MLPNDIILLRRKLKLSQEEFGKLIGVSKNTVYNYEDGKKIPDSKRDILRKLLEDTYSDKNKNADLNIETVKNTNKTEAVKINHEDKNIMYVPLVNNLAYGGYLNGFGDPIYVEELPKIPFLADLEHKGQYICFEAKGDSMDDGTDEAIKERDILLCRNVKPDYWRSKLHINKWDFVIVHKYQGICVKRIIEHDVENGILTLHSLNDYYEDYQVHLEDVAQIFNIVDIQRKKNRR